MLDDKNLPLDGYYYGNIVAAQMRQPKDISKNKYLGITYELLDKDKKPITRMYDMLIESDKAFVVYKRQRFLIAVDLLDQMLTAPLSEIATAIIGKTIIFRVKTERAIGYTDKAIVDISDEGIYYKESDYKNFF